MEPRQVGGIAVGVVVGWVLCAAFTIRSTPSVVVAPPARVAGALSEPPTAPVQPPTAPVQPPTAPVQQELKGKEQKAAGKAAGSRPNIVWHMFDDMGVGEIGAYGTAGRYVEPGRSITTPHLDKFASEGMRFTQAYSGYPICGPSRWTLFSGRSIGRATHPSTQGDALPKVVKAAGYRFALVGKHDPMANPPGHGIDLFAGQWMGETHKMYDTVLKYGKAGERIRNVPTKNPQGVTRDNVIQNPGAYTHVAARILEDGVNVVKTHDYAAQPLFLYMPWTLPHAGCWNGHLPVHPVPPGSPEPKYGPRCGNPSPTQMHYGSEGWPVQETDHAAAVSWQDWAIGEMQAAIKAAGQDESTIVFVTSDNGAHQEGDHSPAFFNSTAGMRGCKGSLYEGGLRVPMMVRWPGHIPAGAVSDYMWQFPDFLPTAAELMGADAQTAMPDLLDSQSVLPTLLGGTQAPRKFIFSTHFCTKTHWNGNAFMIRLGDWKGVVCNCAAGAGLITEADAKSMEVFNLRDDPFETTDLAAQHPEKAQELVALAVAEGLSCKCYQCSTNGGGGGLYY